MIKWLLGNPYIVMIGAALLLASLGGSYFKGRADGRAVVNAQTLRAMKKALDALELRRVQVDQINGRLAVAQTAHDTATREIYHESVKIIDRPVYHNVCVDADGVGLLDRARAAANADLAGEPAGAAR